MHGHALTLAATRREGSEFNRQTRVVKRTAVGKRVEFAVAKDAAGVGAQARGVTADDFLRINVEEVVCANRKRHAVVDAVPRSRSVMILASNVPMTSRLPAGAPMVSVGSVRNLELAGKSATWVAERLFSATAS